MSDPKTYEALYYPFIHFRDEQWIKAMSLYWDGFSRIVPRGYRTHDGDDIRAFVADGVVSDIEPPSRVREAAAVTFESVLDSYEDEIVRRFSLEDVDSW